MSTVNLEPFDLHYLGALHLGGEGGWGKYHRHFYCVLHAKRGEGVQIACKIAYVLNGRPLKCRYTRSKDTVKHLL